MQGSVFLTALRLLAEAASMSEIIIRSRWAGSMKRALISPCRPTTNVAKR
jgi:hypothetical protein